MFRPSELVNSTDSISSSDSNSDLIPLVPEGSMEGNRAAEDEAKFIEKSIETGEERYGVRGKRD